MNQFQIDNDHELMSFTYHNRILIGTKPVSEPEPSNNGTQSEPEPSQKRPNAVGAGNNTLAAEPEPKSPRPEPEKVPTPERNNTRLAGSESKKQPENSAKGLLYGLISIVVPLAVTFC